MQRKLVIGNWKMHGSRETNAALISAVMSGLNPAAVDAVVCVPFPYLSDTAAQLRDQAMAFGAQDCSAHEQGAYTGDVSASMLRDWGCRYVIVGHSERRTYHSESDELVANKAKAALAHGITPIVCVGDTLAEWEAGQTQAVVKRQMSAVIHALGPCIAEIVVAYEPVWAIGTGKSATADQAQAVHVALRAQLAAATERAAAMRLLYGGSVKPDNVAALFAQPDIDGALVGGAALQATSFLAICHAES